MAKSVTLVFHLEEEVSPAIFMEKVIQALVEQGTLRVGEGVQLGNVTHVIREIRQSPPMPWEKLRDEHTP